MQKNYVLVLAGLCMLVYCLMSTAVSAEAPAETPAEVPENNTGFFDPLLTNYKKALNAAFTDNTITADELFRMKNHISLIVTHAGITQNDIFTLLFETASIFAGGGAAGEKADRINKSLQILLRHTDRVITKTLENEKDSARVHLEAGLKTAIRTLKIMRTTTKNRRQANKTDQAAGQAGLEAARAATRESLEQALRAKKNEGATGDPMDKYGWLFGAAGQNETSVTGSNSQSGETQGSARELIDEILAELRNIDPGLTQSEISQLRGLLMGFQKENPGFDLDAFRELMAEYKMLKPTMFNDINVGKVRKQLYQIKAMYPNFNSSNLTEIISKYKNLNKLKR